MRTAQKSIRFVGQTVALLLGLAACVNAPETEISYQKRDYAALPGWGGDDLHGLGTAWRASCAAKPAAEWQAFCAGLPADDGALRAYIEQNLTPWQLQTPSGDTGLFTGYYAPELRASLTQQGPYQTPVYGLPADLAIADLGTFKPELRGQQITGRVERGRFVPYPDRGTIDRQGVPAPVLVWAADPLDVFFLQIQGSGRAALPNGTVLDLGYAGQNGRPYVAIGKLLKNQGAFPDGVVTMPRIRAWLREHPAEQTRILHGNPSYVFFRRLPGPAQGAAGIVLTPERSLAVDTHFTALGSPLWLSCAHPDGNGTLQRLLLAQDTGGAIRGPIRGDVYWGYGGAAAARAGVMQSQGQLYLLWPNGLTPEPVR